MFKVNNRDTRTRCKMCSKLTIKTSERRHSGVFIVNFEHILIPCSSVSIVNFEQVNAGWEVTFEKVRKTPKTYKIQTVPKLLLPFNF